LEKLKPYIDKNLIKVLTGQRRTGKSYILKMLAEYIADKNGQAQIIFIDKERYEFDFIVDYHSLIAYVEGQIQPDRRPYLFIDEIQEIKGFEKALRHFQNKQTADIYCTGSNAELLSGDLATLISGRYVQIQIHTLSYREFLTFHQLEASDNALQKYLKWGGLPFIRNLEKEDSVIFEYLKNIISTIIYKDVLQRYKIRNVDFFDSLLHFIAANTGNLISARKISEYLKAHKTDISTKVIINYLHYLQNAFLLYKVRRLDIYSKKIFEINNKYFFEDWGLRNALLGLPAFSVHNVLENVVFSHLKRCGYEIYIGLLKKSEIDFIAVKDGKKLYIQVAYLIPDAKVKEREFGNLLKINDNFPKMVVSLDPFPVGNYKGVLHKHLGSFLMDEPAGTV